MDRQVIAPQIIDQPARRYRPPKVEEKIGEQRADLSLGNRDQPAVLCPHRKDPEHAETHQVRIARDPSAPAGHAEAQPAAGRQPVDSRPLQGGVAPQTPRAAGRPLNDDRPVDRDRPAR